MKKLKNRKLSTKLTIPYIVILFVLIINVLTGGFFRSDYAGYISLVDVSGELRTKSQKLAFTAELVTRANNNLQTKLEKQVNFIDNTLKVFENGGYITGYENSFNPLPEKNKYILKAVSETWKPLKENYKLIADAQIITRQRTDTLAFEDEEQSISTTVIVSELTPNVKDALDYIEIHNQTFLNDLNKLGKEILSLQKDNRQKSIFFFLLTIVLTIALPLWGIYFSKKITLKPLKFLNTKLKEIVKGNTSVSIEINSKDIFGEIAKSYRKLLNDNNKKTEFVSKITEENYIDLELSGENDKLGKSLINLRDKLILKAKEEKERNENEAKNNWLTKALAEFSDILRKNTDNIEQFTFNLIQYIVNGLDANQAGLFIINDDNKEDIHIELVASIAFNKQKFLKKRIEQGEGLVGRVVLEKKTIYLKNVPDDYVLITSGLGGARPRNIVIIPLLVADEVFGVLELASFKEIEKHQLEFLNKAGESIASTLANVKTNLKTAKLLEESQEQRKILAQKEEEMTNNMSELQQVQEEAKIQEQKLTSFTDSVNHTLIRAEYTAEGELTYANTKFLHKLEYSANSDVEGKQVFSFIHPKEQDEFKEFWEPLSRGGEHFEGRLKHITRTGGEIWMIATYTVVRTPEGGVDKILFLAIDVTEKEEESIDHKGQLEALDVSYIKLEISKLGHILNYNNLFTSAFGFTPEQVKNKLIFDLIPKQDLTNFKIHWESVIHKDFYKGEIKMLKDTGEEIWLNITLAPVFDIYEHVAKLILLGNDITKSKALEEKTQLDAAKIIEQKEELTQNLEEVNVIKEELERSHSEIEENNKKLKTNEKILKKELQKSKEREAEIEKKSKELAKNEEELKFNMEELMATQEQITQQKKILEDKNKVLERNEAVLQKMVEKSKITEQKLKEKEKIVEEKEAEIKKLKTEIKQLKNK